MKFNAHSSLLENVEDALPRGFEPVAGTHRHASAPRLLSSNYRFSLAFRILPAAELLDQSKIRPR